MSGRNQRQVKNWLIAPQTKSKYVFYSLGFGGFSIVLFQTLLINWLNPEDPVLFQKVLFFAIAYLALCTLFGIWMSHQFIGPMVAFRRHIRELRDGNYAHRTHLRKGDEFSEFMDELNRLSERLSENTLGENTLGEKTTSEGVSLNHSQ
jgi:signal transduction histidine kinase